MIIYPLQNIIGSSKDCKDSKDSKKLIVLG